MTAEQQKQATGEAEFQGIVEQLAAIKAAVLKYVEPQAQSPQVVHSANQVVINLDQAYMWFVVALRAAMQQCSPENVEAAVQQAAKEGKLRVLPQPEAGDGKAS